MEEYKLVLLKEDKEKLFEAKLNAKIHSNARISYNDESFTILNIKDEYKEAIKMIVETFLELLEEVDSDGD